MKREEIIKAALLLCNDISKVKTYSNRFPEATSLGAEIEDYLSTQSDERQVGEICPICKETPMYMTCPKCTREMCSPPNKPINLGEPTDKEYRPAMNTKRIKEIQEETAYPESVSVQQALLKVWNECEQSTLRPERPEVTEEVEKKATEILMNFKHKDFTLPESIVAILDLIEKGETR